ncbi:PAS domain S-box protein [Halodesulfurarchaeum sp.]|uniref:PAS domain S-box protein n=1 Tax=Halodesulfurarchaeum sp. TaxID=1980530 RepID=UPI002FC3D9FB
MSETMGEIMVLFVDDEPGLPKLAARNLEAGDDRLQVVTARTVKDAQSLLEGEPVDCIVADYDLPGQDGIDFLQAVREDDADLPFILYTGKGSEEIASEAITNGVTDYFRKRRQADQWAVLSNRIRNAVELHRSQAALEKRREKLQTYEAMVHSMVESACIYDEDARFEIVNENLAEWYGASREELEGTQSNLVHQIRDQFEGDPYEDLYEGRRSKLEGELEGDFPGHGGAVLEYKLSPLRVNGSIEGVVGVTRDITERTRRREELEQAFEEYRDLFNGMNDMAWVLDTDGDFLAVNDAAVERLGYSREELLSMRPQDIDDRLYPEDIRQLIEMMPADEIQVFETVHKTKDGTEIPVEISSSLITYRDEPAILSIGRDVSSRKEREQRLEQFASVVSHDLRNPLNVAQGRLELAQESCESEHLDAVERAHSRMQTLIEDLLSLAREDEPVTETEPVALETLARESWASVETPTTTLVADLDRVIQADRGRLRRVFENLMRNAIEHNGPDVAVTVGELPAGFFVEDDGSGIPKSKQEDIFEAGYSTAEEGTGFGLSIVEQIVEAHEWELTLTESEAGGARFEVTGVEFVDC